jgi:hypothetical protein
MQREERDAPVAIVQAWQDAANAGDIDRLLALSDPRIELVGPRGSGRGHELLRQWMARAGVTFETGRLFARADRVVVAQHAEWRAGDRGASSGTAEVASVFDVVDRRVTRLARYDDLMQALAAAGLGLADEVPTSGTEQELRDEGDD